jgi:RecB family exonuclease
LPERPEGCFAQKTPDPFFRSRFEIPKPAPLARPITSMRVTEFRDYLACPYRYYLRHILKLEAIEPGDELDGAGFGTVTHDVLERFGKDPIKDSTDADSIRGFLNDHLDQLVAERFGGDAVPAVRVQIEQLRLRLDAFANWQAKWRGQGWRIEHVERSVSGQDAPFDVDGKPMYLRGRIDRIDHHERDGTWCVLDYKTGEDGDTPGKTHGKAGAWKDLQLPLYRHLLRAIGITGDVRLGYIVLPRDPTKVGELLADWTADDLASADKAARDVVRGIRAGEFPGPAESARGFDEFAWICQEGRTVPPQEPDEEDEP